MLALPLAEYREQLKQFMDAHGSSNVAFSSAILGYENIRARELRMQANLAMVWAAVEYKLHGEAGLKSVNDPLGKGPFLFERFVFQGVDRGFKLASAHPVPKLLIALIFVEKDGPGFMVEGPHIGEALRGAGTEK